MINELWEDVPIEKSLGTTQVHLFFNDRNVTAKYSVPSLKQHQVEGANLVGQERKLLSRGNSQTCVYIHKLKYCSINIINCLNPFYIVFVPFN